MVQNQNEFVKMQSLVAAYDAGLEARDVSLWCEIFGFLLLSFPQKSKHSSVKNIIVNFIIQKLISTAE